MPPIEGNLTKLSFVAGSTVCGPAFFLLPVMSSFFPARTLGVLIALAIGIPAFSSSGFGADDDAKKKRPKPKPVDLAAVKPRGGAAATSTDILAAPVYDISPDTPEHLRPVRLFNKDGRYLDARLLSASSEAVTVQRLSDSRTFELELAALDAPSVRRVEAWLDRGPESQEYSIEFEVKKRFVESDQFATLGRIIKTMSWSYDVVLTNQSRNELRNATLEYQIIYDDEVEIVRTSAYPGEGRDQREMRGVDLPPIGFNGRAEFTTPPVVMDGYEYEPTRGEREYRRDRITGIWIRVYKNGEVVAEHMSHPASMESLSWDQDDDIEITVRDSFKDQFDSEP